MTHDQSICIRPNLPPYSVSRQNVTFQVENLKSDGKVAVWKTQLGKGPVAYFERQLDVQLVNGTFNLELGLDQVYTVTTLTNQGNKGSYSTPPAPAKYVLQISS